MRVDITSLHFVILKIMKTINELNDRKIPIVKMDITLEKFKNMALFQDKVDKANETLRNLGCQNKFDTVA